MKKKMEGLTNHQKIILQGQLIEINPTNHRNTTFEGWMNSFEGCTSSKLEYLTVG
jgi:hypothetical protein